MGMMRKHCVLHLLLWRGASAITDPNLTDRKTGLRGTPSRSRGLGCQNGLHVVVPRGKPVAFSAEFGLGRSGKARLFAVRRNENA